jgi:drug/metabolite transporter (DMT)-like permease
VDDGRTHDVERSLALAFLGVVGFSFTLPMTKIVVRGLDPVVAAMGRAVVAAALAAGALAVTGRARPRPDQVRRLAVVGTGVVLGFPLCTAFAVRLVPAVHGAVVIGLLPLATAGLGVVRAGERPSPRYWACSAAGLGAVVAYAVHEGGGSLHLADLLLVGAVAAAAVGYAAGAELSREMPGWAVISWALVLALPVTAAATAIGLAVGTSHHLTAGQGAAFAYTAPVSMFYALFSWYAGLAGAGLARAGQLQLTQPVLSIAWCWPLLGERLTAAAVLTAAVVLVAVAIGRRADIAAVPAVAATPPTGP